MPELPINVQYDIFNNPTLGKRYGISPAAVSRGRLAVGAGGGTDYQFQGAGAGYVGFGGPPEPPPQPQQGPLGLLGAIPGLPAWLTGLIGAAGVGYSAYQALGGGEGGGLFGLNILGGDEFVQNGIPFGGPGLPEPPAQYVLKEWHVNYDWGRLQYYLVQMPTGGRKIAMYNTRTKRWKVWAWRTPHLAVIGKNMPSHKMITRLRRNLKRHSADARTILKMTSPASLEKHHYHRRHK